MFEQPVGKVEKDRSRLIMIVSAVAVVVVIGLIVLVGTLGRREPEKLQLSGPGSSEFDSYAPYLAITDLEKFEGESLNSRYGRVTARIRNTGDRIVTGLQVRGTAIGLNDEILRQRTVTVVPGVRDVIDPNGSIEIDLRIDPIPDPTQVKEMTLEIAGLKLQ